MRPMIHKMIYIISILSAALILSGAAAVRTLYGEFADITTGCGRTAFVRSYLLMDCCSEWEEFCRTVRSTGGAASAEGLEFYEYNKNGRQMLTRGEVTVLFHPTEEFASQPFDRIEVCSLSSGKRYEAAVTETGDISVKVEESGVFAFVKILEHPPGPVWISNIQDCNGECRACSDGW